MPFGCYAVPHKECLHLRHSTGNVYAAFLLLPHLFHLCCLFINLREAKREIFTTLLSSLSCPLHCPGARLLAAEWNTTRPLISHRAFSANGQELTISIFLCFSPHSPCCRGLHSAALPSPGAPTLAVPRAALTCPSLKQRCSVGPCCGLQPSHPLSLQDQVK